MSLLAAFLLLQPVTNVGTVPVRNAELDAAHACLTIRTERLLAEGRSEPNKKNRWSWAIEIVGGCEPKIAAAADTKDAVAILGDHAYSSISKRNMLRAEATYFVDRLVREHFERIAVRESK